MAEAEAEPESESSRTPRRPSWSAVDVPSETDVAEARPSPRWPSPTPRRRSWTPPTRSTPPDQTDDDEVIDLVDGDATKDAVDDAAWRAVVLEPEPDAVDHVLQALINRARFKQVGVEEVATELVERADLRGEEVSDVLAELVERADDRTLDAARPSELTLFNDEVPSRPGQLTDFAKLAPADKKRIIIRVLCLLVARSEDQQLPGLGDGEGAAARSWPLARAVWPLGSDGSEGEAQLPSRRLAKSG